MSTTPEVTETPNFGVEQCDPGEIAPAVVITNTPDMTSPGHGYTLPLVGRVRPHTFEAVLPGVGKRVFADNPSDVLAELIEGYGELEQALDQAKAAGDEETIGQRELETFEARSRHATSVRCTLQRQINAQAREDGTWEQLTDEERQQLETAADADGAVPTGVLYLGPAEDDLGNEVEEEFGRWSAIVRLVINRGEYNTADPDVTITEPESDLETVLPDGRSIVIPVEHPENLVRLSPIDPFTYLMCLERAGIVSVTERPYVPIDDLYEDVMEAGSAGAGA